MKIFVLVLVVLVNIILQGTVFQKVAVGGVKPDLLLFLVIFAALLEGPRGGIKTGFLVGLAQDLIAGKYIGLYTLTKMLTGFMVGMVEPKIFKENYLVPVVVLFFGTIFHEFLFMFFGDLVGRTAAWVDGWRAVVLPLAIFHALIGPFLYVPVYKAYVRWWKDEN